MFEHMWSGLFDADFIVLREWITVSSFNDARE